MNRWTELLRSELQKYFNPFPDKEDEAQTIDAITSAVRFRGAQLWVLAFAIFIASLGLNVNSTAVIIGAMLISPLMGPIIGMGLAVGIGDWGLLKTSGKNFIVATVISILTATLYFLLSPYSEVQSELLARTSPTLYDVLIAFFGGAAGFMATATHGKGNVIPGVAIATALMPPLCTAGFGLATLRPAFFFGALYLFFINTVFIALSTYLGTRLLRFRQKKHLDPQRARRVHRYILALVILTLIPASVMTAMLVQKSIFQRNLANYVNVEWNIPGVRILSNEVDRKAKKLRLIAVGREIQADSIETRRSRLANYGLEKYDLQVIQGTQSDSLIRLNQRISQMAEKSSDRKQAIRDQQKHIMELEALLAERTRYDALAPQLHREALSLYPSLASFSLAPMTEATSDTTMQSMLTAVVRTRHGMRLTSDQQHTLRRWLTARLETDTLRLVVSE